MVRIIFVLFFSLFLTGKAGAVIPPLNDEDRISRSSHIVEGTVRNSATMTEDDNLGTRHKYTLTVMVNSVLTGIGISAGTTIDIHFWRVGRRANNWVGDTGQRGSFVPGKSYRFFLKDGELGFHLLSPNGSDAIETPFPYLAHRENNYSLYYPADWESESMQHNGLTRFMPIAKDGMPPVASNITINQMQQGCVVIEAWEKHIRQEISQFIDAEIDKPTVMDGGNAVEIGYSWKDTPHQSDRFRNLDRVVCRDSNAYLIRYYSTQNEFEQYLPVVRLLNRSIRYQGASP